MEMAEGSSGEHGIRHESLLLFLSPPQSRVMFRAKGEGHGWSLLFLLLFLHHKASPYIKDVMVIVLPILPTFLLFVFKISLKRQRMRKRRMERGSKFTTGGRGKSSSLVDTSPLLFLLLSIQFNKRGSFSSHTPSSSSSSSSSSREEDEEAE